MRGKLFVIEGTDSSGKETQTKLLYEKLIAKNIKILKIQFPDYESQSSALVKMYLNGDFGKNPQDINPYASSLFYAVDRYASFKTKWEKFYESGGVVLSDRYTTSNMIHQTSKIENEDKKEEYLKWLWDLEFNKIGLPIPDKIFFLDMPYEISIELMNKRKNKISCEKDIHEKDIDYIKKSYEVAISISKKYGWHHIKCAISGKLRTIDEINEEILSNIQI